MLYIDVLKKVVNPLVFLGIFICLFYKGLQLTTRCQFYFFLVEFVKLLHMYHSNVLKVKLDWDT